MGQRRLAAAVCQYHFLLVWHVFGPVSDDYDCWLRLCLSRVSRQTDAVLPAADPTDDHAGGDDGAEHDDPQTVRSAQYPDRRDDALFCLSVWRVLDASGVPQYSA